MRPIFVYPLLAAAIFSLAPLASGCYVEDDPPVYAEGYQPQYYNGYVVYYDDGGRPYYYANGSVVWVAATDPLYFGLVNHWRVYRPAYGRWNARYGARYRGWHRR
jgi:hypothetical protein